MAIMTFCRDDPSTATIARAIMRPGKAINESTSLWKAEVYKAARVGGDHRQDEPQGNPHHHAAEAYVQ